MARVELFCSGMIEGGLDLNLLESLLVRLLIEFAWVEVLFSLIHCLLMRRSLEMRIMWWVCGCGSFVFFLFSLYFFRWWDAALRIVSLIRFH